MNARIDPQAATVADVVTLFYGNDDPHENGLSYDSPSNMVEAYCREAVRLATPFDPVQLGVLEGALLTDSWRRFNRRTLKAWVRGIIKQVQDYQKAARAAARREKKKAPRI